MRKPLALVSSVVLAVFAVACGPEAPLEAEWVDEGEIDSEFQEIVAKAAIPTLGSPTAFDVACWNLEWFGSNFKGPEDKNKQRNNVAAVMKGLDIDLWVLSEVVSAEQFASLLKRLPGYAGLLVNDERVADGATFYSTSEQKVAVIFKKDTVTVESAQVILGEHHIDFGRRPPLEVALRITQDGVEKTMTVMALHLKAMPDPESYEARKRSAAALKKYLDTERANEPVMVAGDWNDDIDESMAKGRVSPFGVFVRDTERYQFTTDSLTEAGIPTTVSYPTTVDHHLVTSALRPRFVEGSALVFRADEHLKGYAETTSDHFPVLTQYELF